MTAKFIIFSILFFTLRDITLTQDIWEPLDFPDTTRIMSITVNKQGYIYVGVLWSNFSNGGVYRSVDSANNWEFCGFYKRSILSLTINTNGTVYAGSSHSAYSPGLFRSYDYGQTWDTVNFLNQFLGNIVNILTIGDDTLLISTWGNTGQVYRTTDTGQSWELIYDTDNSAEYVSDIEMAENGDLYVCMQAYYYNLGGVYRSSDFGDSWEFLGLLNYTVRAIEFNQYGDLYAGTGVGLFVMYKGENEWIGLLGLNVKDIIFNNDGLLFVQSDDYNGIVKSADNGQSFEYFNSGIFQPWLGAMALDSSGYLIASKYDSPMLYRTINSTLITQVPEVPIKIQFIELNVFPNPTSEFIVTDLPENFCFNCKMELQLFDLTGKIYQCKYSVDKTKNLILTVGNLPVGLYLLKIILNRYIYYSKFIKK